MVDYTPDEAVLHTLLVQHLADDESAAGVCDSVASILNSCRPFERACRQDGSVTVKKWIAKINTLLHHADSAQRYIALMSRAAAIFPVFALKTVAVFRTIYMQLLCLMAD